MLEHAVRPAAAPTFSTYPVAKEDVALVVAATVPAADVEAALREGPESCWSRSGCSTSTPASRSARARSRSPSRCASGPPTAPSRRASPRRRATPRCGWPPSAPAPSSAEPGQLIGWSTIARKRARVARSPAIASSASSPRCHNQGVQGGGRAVDHDVGLHVGRRLDEVDVLLVGDDLAAVGIGAAEQAHLGPQLVAGVGAVEPDVVGERTPRRPRAGTRRTSRRSPRRPRRRPAGDRPPRGVPATSSASIRCTSASWACRRRMNPTVWSSDQGPRLCRRRRRPPGPPSVPRSPTSYAASSSG